MKLGCFYSHIVSGVTQNGLVLCDAMKIARKHGIKALDIDARYLEEMPPMDFYQLITEQDLCAASVYEYKECNVTTEEGYASSIALMKEAMRNAVKIKSPLFMPVPVKPRDYKEIESDVYVKGFRQLFADLTEYGKEIGIQVIVENYSLISYPYTSFEDIKYLLGHNPELKYALDVGNYHLAGFDELEGANLFINKTIHVHLKDLKIVEDSNLFYNGKYYDSLEIGGGCIKTKEVLSLLKKNGYQGYLIIEINSGSNKFDRMIKSADYLAKIGVINN